MADTIRTFIAVRFSDEVNRELARMQQLLRRADRRGAVKWVEPGNVHLTLQFLGDVERARLLGLRGALEPQLSVMPAFTVELRGAGAFPSPSRPQVIWAGVARGAAELERLAQAVQRTTGTLGFAPESRPFRPHVTLGRVKRACDAGALRRALDELSGFTAGNCHMAVVEIVSSVLGAKGPSYSTLDALGLKGYDTGHLNRPWEAR